MAKKKILILTASPIRDRYVDELIAGELRALGNEVWVKPCLREGRPAVLDLQPDVVVVPPIRNPYSRDFAIQLKRWNCGLVTRHTEASCSWQDWKAMNEDQRAEIVGHWIYPADVELVWGGDEAQILQQRKCAFPVISVGSFIADVYKNEDYKQRLSKRGLFNQKYGFATKKRNLLIASPWGFADSAPDLRIDDIFYAKKDSEGRDRHIKMVRTIAGLKDKWNILLTIHPGVAEEPYKELSKELGIPLETESPMIEMLINCDALIHAGSTAAISAHILNIPAFQYGDVNTKSSENWWGMPSSAISMVSPYYKSPKELLAAFKKFRKKSNASRATLDTLEKGRYGSMDGKATKRAADIINKVTGKFTMCWPESTQNYNQPGIAYQKLEDVCRVCVCGVCKKNFLVVMEYLKEHDFLSCPWCAARSYMK